MRIETYSLEGCWGQLVLDPSQLKKEIYTTEDVPSRIPHYELDHFARIEPDGIPKLTGIYLPDIDYAPACFIPADYGQPATARHGIKTSNWVDPDTGKKDYSWEESTWAKTGWTLICHVEGEFIDVPQAGFFPEGKPEELYTWPQREQELQREKKARITRWTDETAPCRKTGIHR